MGTSNFSVDPVRDTLRELFKLRSSGVRSRKLDKAAMGSGCADHVTPFCRPTPCIFKDLMITHKVIEGTELHYLSTHNYCKVDIRKQMLSSLPSEQYPRVP